MTEFGGNRMSRVRTVHPSCSALALTLFLAACAAAEPPLAGKLAPIRAAPLSFVAGKPLSSWTLVEDPPPVTGLVSWTIETRRHRGELRAMILSPNGQIIATGGSDATIRFWDTVSRKLVRILVAHDFNVNSLSWSPDGKVLASSGSFDKTVRLWNVETGLLLRTFPDFKDYVETVRWSADGRRLAAAGGFSGWIWIWDTQSDRAALLTEDGQQIGDLDWSPDGSQLAAVIEGTPVSTLDAKTGKAVQSFGDAEAVAYCARWSPDGKKLVIGNDRETALYAVPQGTLLWKRPGSSWGAVWSRNGRRLAMNRADRVHIMNAADGQTATLLPYGAASLAWIWPQLVVLRHEDSVSEFHATTGKFLGHHVLAGTRPPAWEPGRPIVSGLATKTLHLWDGMTAEKSLTLSGHTASVHQVAWQPAGDVLASAAEDKTIRLWDTKQGKLLHTIEGLAEPALRLAWSPDGQTLASSGTGHTVRLTSVSGKSLAQLAGHTGPVTALAWSHRGDLLASGSDDRTVALWDFGEKKLRRKLSVAREVRSLALHPNSSLLACGTSDAALQLWLVGNGKQVRKNLISDGGSPAVTSLDWLHDGRLLLAGRANSTLQIWDWLRAEVSGNFWTYAPVETAKFSADGSRLVAAAAGRGVFVWRRVEGELLGVILDQGDGVVLLDAHGNFRCDSGVEPDIFYVAQTAEAQLTLKPAEFTARYSWTNRPETVTFTADAAA
ncbi:MAG TPA: WD40 repeat domain-containing protein, partial [Pirellulales bacterium]|nr:WD40 repeat domain-containing protein [Pirellulales bacterium]